MVRCPPIPLGLHGGEASKRTGHRRPTRRPPPPPTHSAHPAMSPSPTPFPAPSSVSLTSCLLSQPNSPLHNHPHPNLALALPLTPISPPPPAPTSPSDRVVARYRDRRARTRSDVGCRGEPAQADVRGMGQPPRSVGEAAGGTSKERERERGGDESAQRACEPMRLRDCAPTNMCACGRT